MSMWRDKGTQGKVGLSVCSLSLPGLLGGAGLGCSWRSPRFCGLAGTRVNEAPDSSREEASLGWGGGRKISSHPAGRAPPTSSSARVSTFGLVPLEKQELHDSVVTGVFFFYLRPLY